MGSEFTFYDYIDADGGGNNVIKDWLNGGGSAAKARFTVLIELLESSPPRGHKDTIWKYPYMKPMEGEWAGFVELRRKDGNVQHRLLAQIRGRGIYLVASGIHKEQNFTTDVSPQTALKRVQEMIDDPARYRREHEYS